MRTLMRSALALAGLGLAACLSTQDVSIGAFAPDAGTRGDTSDDAQTPLPEPVDDLPVEMTQPAPEAGRSEPDRIDNSASGLSLDGGSLADASEHDATTPDEEIPDAKAPDAGLAVVDAAVTDGSADAGHADSSVETGEAGADSGPNAIDSALSLLCMVEPWHCP